VLDRAIKEAYQLAGITEDLATHASPPPTMATLQGVLDADRGGREGAERFGEILRGRWRPLALPDGLDLNDLGRRPDGRRLFFQLVDMERRKALEEARERGRNGDVVIGEEAVDVPVAS